MYYKCTWCNARIIAQPIYYTQGFHQLRPGFEIYCNADCSLSAYESASNSKKPAKNVQSSLKQLDK